MAYTLLELDQIGKRFNDNFALENISLDLQKGEVHFITGENGSGKSALMKIISGCFLPDSGSIAIDGQRVVLGPAPGEIAPESEGDAAQAGDRGHSAYLDSNSAWRPTAPVSPCCSVIIPSLEGDDALDEDSRGSNTIPRLCQDAVRAGHRRRTWRAPDLLPASGAG